MRLRTRILVIVGLVLIGADSLWWCYEHDRRLNAEEKAQFVRDMLSIDHPPQIKEHHPIGSQIET